MFGAPITLLLHIIVVVVFSFRVISRRLAVHTTLAWLMVIAALPVIGLLIYFLFGDHRLGRKRLKLGPKIRQHFQDAYEIDEAETIRKELEVSDYFRHMSKVISRETGFHPSIGNKIKLYSEAHDLFDRLIQDIDDAKEHLFLEFYIIDPQGRVNEVLEAIIRAAKRGVDCRLLADDFGSKTFLKSHWPRSMMQVGVRVEASLSVGLLKSVSKRTDLRNHRKIIVIDQSIGYTGSLNLADPDYFKRDANVGAWVDIMIRLEGHIVSSLAVVFNTDFIFDHVGTDFDKSDIMKLPQNTPNENFARDAVLQLIPSGPESYSSLIYEVIVSAIFGAQKRITITTPYFVPDEAIVLALCNAAKRGLEVRVILPHKVDSLMARFAGQAVFSEMLRAGVQIYRYQGGMLHTKSILIDDDISFVGTVNVDMRSFYLNLEITMAVYDRFFHKALSRVVEDYIENSHLIDRALWKKRSFSIRWKENLMRLAGPLL